METREWVLADNSLAREKTSQAFRDALHDEYKSSRESKKKRRIRAMTELNQTSPQLTVIRSESETKAKRYRYNGKPDKDVIESVELTLSRLMSDSCGVDDSSSSEGSSSTLLGSSSSDLSQASTDEDPTEISLGDIDLLESLQSSFSHLEEDENPFEPLALSDSSLFA